MARAAPTPPARGMRIQFSSTFKTPPTSVATMAKRMRFSVMRYRERATPRATNTRDQMWICRIRADSPNSLVKSESMIHTPPTVMSSATV